MRLPRPVIALLILGVVPAAAHAARGDYRALSFNEAADPGLTVSGRLGETFVAVARARVVVPGEWKRLSAGADRLRFITPGRGCRYVVTMRVRSAITTARDMEAYATGALPAETSAHVLDRGTRASTSAFRVVREPLEARVRLRGLRAAVLTRRDDIAPAGSIVVSELRATATSRKGDECHSGTYRERLGPQLGDALATARTSLKFVRKPR